MWLINLPNKDGAKKHMKSNQIRSLFLQYFNNNKHTIVKSSPLVPANDPTLLFTNAGMVQFKDVFLGHEKLKFNRAVTVQRCVRAGGKHNDLENVGYTARHHTFFEMLGNFSFGDYFKREAIKFAWNFLTVELKLPAEKLWVTVYEKDDEAADIWLNELQVSPDRFSRCGEKDNFWAMGNTGPCGPCSEIFYDHGEKIEGGPPGSPLEDGDRYIEIWNLVFMQYNRNAQGELSDLPKPSVDTGMGLERLAAVLQGVHSNYQIDLFQALMKAIAKIVGVDNHELTSIRVIADHIRSCAFMIVDGIIPGNDGRAYVLRRIIRRAIRHGHKLSCKQHFLYKIVEPLVQQMGDAYPELKDQQAMVEEVLFQEESRFAETVEQGIKMLNDYIAQLQTNTIAGEMVFKLYDTYGFPVDLTADIAREKNLSLDMQGYKHEMQLQQQRARKASSFSHSVDANIVINTSSEFVGYQTLTQDAKITNLLVAGDEVTSIKPEQEAMLVLDKTSFYAESGGQIADTGTIIGNNGQFIVADVQKKSDAIIHFGQLKSGSLSTGDKVDARVNPANRTDIMANHSATHLLHSALRQILGHHVQQKGSLVTADKLRFDFSHNKPVNNQQLQQIEDLVNLQIQNKLPVTTELMSPELAVQKGAMALFGEKYGEIARVLTMGDFSIELCGGTHVSNTEEIKLIKIIAETGIAAGVRRIEALSSTGAINLLQQSHQLLDKILLKLKTRPNKLINKIDSILVNNKTLDKELADKNKQLAKIQQQDLESQVLTIGECKMLVASVLNQDAKTLRTTMDGLKTKFNRTVVLLATVIEDKIFFVCGVTNNMTGIIKAGDIIKHIVPMVGGKGGGRPDMAQGGGSALDKLPQAMEDTKQWIVNKIS